MQVEIDKLFTVLRTEPEIEAYINPFVNAFFTNFMEPLEGQLDAVKIGIARLFLTMFILRTLRKRFYFGHQ